MGRASLVYPGIAQLEECLAWDQEAAGSRPATRTKMACWRSWFNSPPFQGGIRRVQIPHTSPYGAFFYRQETGFSTREAGFNSLKRHQTEDLFDSGRRP